MLNKLSKSTKATREIKKFEAEINKIKEESAKKLGHELLQKLKYQSNVIDQLHSPLSAPSIDNEKIKENIESLVKIREKILKLIRDATPLEKR